MQLSEKRHNIIRQWSNSLDSTASSEKDSEEEKDSSEREKDLSEITDTGSEKEDTREKKDNADGAPQHERYIFERFFSLLVFINIDFHSLFFQDAKGSDERTKSNEEETAEGSVGRRASSPEFPSNCLCDFACHLINESDDNPIDSNPPRK